MNYFDTVAGHDTVYRITSALERIADSLEIIANSLESDDKSDEDGKNKESSLHE